MASFRQRDSGYWQGIVRRKGHPEESRTFRTKADAETWARDVESKIDKGIFISASEAERTTFSDLVKAFETDFAPLHYKAREDKKESWRFQIARLDEFFGSYSLAAIDQKLVARFRDMRLRGTGDRKAVGDRYRAMGFEGRDPVKPQFTDHCFTGDYPTPLTDRAGAVAQQQLSLLAEAS